MKTWTSLLRLARDRAVIGLSVSGVVTCAALVSASQKEIDRWLGTWDKSSSASLEIARDKVEPSRIVLSLLVTTPGGCIGEAKGHAAASELTTRAVTIKAGSPDSDDRDCRLMLKLSEDGREITVVEDDGCTDLHGALCHFDGRYQQ